MDWWLGQSANNEEAFCLKSKYPEKEFSEPPTGVEPMTFQIPVGHSRHWAMGDSWWARSYTRFLYVWHVSCRTARLNVPNAKRELHALLRVPRQSLILRSTSYIAIELKCSVFEVVRNSIESMCSSYSAFDCISWNRLIAYYSFTDLYTT